MQGKKREGEATADDYILHRDILELGEVKTQYCFVFIAVVAIIHHAVSNAV